jgi:hypothetical protein
MSPLLALIDGDGHRPCRRQPLKGHRTSLGAVVVPTVSSERAPLGRSRPARRKAFLGVPVQYARRAPSCRLGRRGDRLQRLVVDGDQLARAMGSLVKPGNDERLIQPCTAHGVQKNLALIRPERQMFDDPGDRDIELRTAQPFETAFFSRCGQCGAHDVSILIVARDGDGRLRGVQRAGKV